MRKDPAFLYGESIFTTTRAKRGKALFLKQHLNRLYNGIEDYYLGRELKDDEKNSIEKSIREKLCELPKDEQRFRVTIYSKSRDSILPKKFEFKDLKLDFQFNPLTKFSEPLELRSYPSPFSIHYPNMKMGSYMPLMRLKMHARRAGADDAVLINDKSNFLEASTSNLLFSRGERLFTPVDSVVKGISVSEIEKVKEVERMEIPLGMSSGFDMAMVTNSVWIAAPVRKIDDVEYENLNAGFIQDMVNEVVKRGYREE